MKHKTIQDSIQHSLDNTIYSDSIIRYMAKGDKKLYKKLKTKKFKITKK